MRQGIVLTFAIFLLVEASAAQTRNVDLRAEEAAIRALANGPVEKLPRTSDEIFWSGATPRPTVRPATVAPFPEASAEQRRNQKQTWETLRIEVAQAGDMAYEFANFALSYDLADTKEHVSFPGSALRVWKKVNGQWTVAATFQRPHNAYARPAVQQSQGRR